MKKTFYLTSILFFFVLTFSACSEEPTTPTGGGGTVTSIEGVWTFENLSQKNGKVSWNGVPVSTYVAQTSNEKGTANFKSDGTFETSTSYDLEVVFTVSGETNTQNSSVPTTVVKGTYTYDHTTKELVTTTAGNSVTTKVVELTANSFIYELDVVREDTNNGVLVKSTNTTRAEYSK